MDTNQPADNRNPVQQPPQQNPAAPAEAPAQPVQTDASAYQTPVQQNTAENGMPPADLLQPLQVSRPLLLMLKNPVVLILLGVVGFIMMLGILISGITRPGNHNDNPTPTPIPTVEEITPSAEPTVTPTEMPTPSPSPVPTATSMPTAVPTATAVPVDPNTYTSQNFGVSFGMPSNTEGMNFTVSETASKICIHAVNDPTCQNGQTVEFFQKDSAQTLEQAITAQFLAGKDPSKCWPGPYPIPDLPAGYKTAEIAFSMDGVNAENIYERTTYCSQNYARSTDTRYFLMDTGHPSRFFFFSLGQYSITTKDGKNWQDTFTVLR